MTKVITVTSIRSGAGKTTVAALMAEKLAEKYTVCLIDNNQNNINIYSAVSTIENINLYICLADKESCRRAIKESAVELKKNLYFFLGSRELLTKKEINILKERDIFEYIIIDSESDIRYELFDYSVTVVNPNNSEYMIVSQSEYKSEGASNDIIIINRYTDNSEFKVKKQDFKLYFCAEIINFANGYELVLPEKNQTEIDKIIKEITGEESPNGNRPKFKLFGRR